MRAEVNDRWSGTIVLDDVGRYEDVVEAWRDRFATGRHDVENKAAAGDEIEVELEEGARILEELAEKLRSRSRKRVLAAVAGLRRTSCILHVLLSAGLDDQVAALVAGVPDADVTTTGFQLWVDRPLAG